MDRSCAYYAAKYWCCVCHKVQFADKGFQEKRDWENTDFTIIQLTENSDGTGWQNTFLLQFDNMHQSYHRLHTHSWYISIAEGKVRRLLYGSRLKPDIHQTLAMGQSLADPLTRLTGRVSCWPQVHPSVDPKCSLLPNLMSAPRSFNPLSVLKLVIIKTRKWKILCSCFKIVNRKAKAIVNDNLLDNWIIFIDYESWQFWIMLNSSWTSFLLAKEL